MKLIGLVLFCNYNVTTISTSNMDINSNRMDALLVIQYTKKIFTIIQTSHFKGLLLPSMIKILTSVNDMKILTVNIYLG